MTTSVTVKAHCDPDTTKVKLEYSNAGFSNDIYIFDGDEYEVAIFDVRNVKISEVPIDS